MKIDSYSTPERKLVNAEEVYQHVKRYCLHSALAELGIVGMKIFKKDKTIEHLLPNTLAEWQLAFLAKALILNSNDHRREPFGDKGLANCVNLYNSLHDKLMDVAEADENSAKLKALDEFLIRLANQQFPFQLNVRHLVPRALYLFDEIPNELKSKKLDIRKDIQRIYGMSVKELIVIGFAIWAKSTNGYFNPEGIINAETEELRKHLPRQKVEKLVSLLTADYYKLRDKFKEDEGEPGYEQYAFNSLRTYPIVQTQIAGLVIPVPRFILERITNGVYFSLMDNYKKEKSNIFLEFFGKEIFENYVGKLLGFHYQRKQLLREFEYGTKKFPQKSPDWIIIEGDCAILIECKTSGITKEAKTWAELKKVQVDLRKRAVRGIIQMEDFIADVKNGKVKNSALKSIKKFYPIILTYDRIFLSGTPVMRKLIKEELKGENKETENYQILGIDELENLIPILKKFSLSELLEIKKNNSEWSTYDFDSYTSYLIKDKDISIELENLMLKEKFDSFFKEISPNLGLKK